MRQAPSIIVQPREPEAVLVYMLRLIYLQEAGTAGQPNRGDCYIAKKRERIRIIGIQFVSLHTIQQKYNTLNV